MMLLLVLFLVMPQPVFAAWHLYVVPTEIQSRGETTPAYLLSLKFFAFAFKPYGAQKVGLLAADVPDETDLAMQDFDGVARLPDNLDQVIGAQLATVRAKLEAMNLPVEIDSATTYRQVLRTIYAMLQFFNRFRSITKINVAVINGSTVTLDTTYASLPANVQKGLQDAAASLGLSTAGITGTSTVRQILKAIADQRTVPFVLGKISI